jgi:uroporphyrinogen-III synthase
MPTRRRSLEGQSVVITRSREQSAKLAELLAAAGAAVIECPTISIVPARDYAPLDAAIATIDSYDWIIFTSVNGFSYFEARYRLSARATRPPAARICAIGPATAAAVTDHGWSVHLMPEEYVAESLVEAFRREEHPEGRRILLPRAAVARDVVPQQLRAHGATVDVIEAYRTQQDTEAAHRIPQIFGGPQKPHWITFTSSSTVTHFVSAASSTGTASDYLAGVQVASIGPVTSDTARRHGMDVAVEANLFTVEGLVEAILESRSASPLTHPA